ncbi:MAG TPA: hypothetical protein PLB68_09505 [Candidatus Aminicenantes bacterium]|nr:hypothetical protein [Candidatus Aminicenantes bacterium]
MTDQTPAPFELELPLNGEELTREALELLEKMDKHRPSPVFPPDGGGMNDQETLRFFRNRERNEMSLRLIQSLLAFMDQPPQPLRGPFNPYSQIRELVRFQVELLGERDVREAVLKERVPPQAPPPLLEREVERLEVLRLRLMGEAFQPSLPYQEGYRRLLETLRQLFHFWAGLRGRKDGRVRRSDLLLYRLAEYIENKLSETPLLVDTPGEME